VRSLKVVHLTTAHDVFDVRIFNRECCSLARHGHNVTLITAGFHQDVPTEHEGVHIRIVPAPKMRLERMTISVLREFYKAVREKADIYHFHDPELMFAALGLRAIGKVVIQDVHEDVPQQILFSLWVPRGLRRAVCWLYERLERFSLRSCSAVIAANPEIATRIALHNRDVTLLRNYPTSGDLLSLSVNKSAIHRQPIIVSFGGISPQTCTLPIVKAMELLPPEITKNLILGGHIVSDPLLERVSLLPGWKRVVYKRLTPRQEMIRLLCRASVALVLYSPEPNHFGVGSNRFYEALGAGVPVITSNFPNWSALVERLGCGLTVDPQDPRQIADAITFLLTHQAAAEEMGRRGREAVLRELNWDTEQLKLLQLYHRLAPVQAPSCCETSVSTRSRFKLLRRERR
jgi:glycosyltransferase involved in cell wall biosynthesis